MINEEKKLINEIKNRALEFKNDSKYKDKYEEYENMKQTLSDNLYSKNSHFIYELIQNAEDNTYSKNVSPKIKFIIDDSGILTQNNEIGFNSNNIESICKFSSSSKKGNKELGFIGEKGLGFKSVFAVSSNPAIYSNNYHFSFLEGEYTIPYWIEEDDFKNYPSEFLKKDSTNIYLKFKDNFLYKDDIKNKISEIEPIIILFLKKLSNIEIYRKNKQLIDVSKKSIHSPIEKFKVNQLKYDKFEDIYYLTNKIITKPKNIDEPKREKVFSREIVIAFPSFDNKEKEDRVFSFLPTEIHTGLPFLIQSDFILIGNRENIIEDNKWNLWLMDEIVEFFAEEFEKLKELDKYKYLKYLDKEKSTNIFIDKYYQQILEKLQEKDLFLTTDETFVKSSNIAILEDFNFMFKYLKDIKYTNQNKERNSYLNNEFYIPEHIIRNWKITKITKKEFLRIIGNCNKFFAQKFENDCSLFEEFLNYIGNDFRDENILGNLPIIPISDEKGKVKFYSFEELKNYQIFFELDDEGVLNNIFQDSKVISKEYKKKLEDITFYSSIFKIKQPKLTDILKSLELDFFRNENKNVELLVYIKEIYKNNEKENEKEIVDCLNENYHFLTNSGKLVRQTFENIEEENKLIPKINISKSYTKQNNSIQNIVDTYCCYSDVKDKVFFISDKYFQRDKSKSNKDNNTLKNEWEIFLSKLKIDDEIKFEKCKYDGYTYYNIPFLANVTSERDISYLPMIHLDSFSPEDSIFLYKKINTTNFTSYTNMTEIKRSRAKNLETPWKTFIKSDFRIFINGKKSEIKDIYLSVDKRLNKFFNSLPNEYGSSNSQIFSFKNCPDLENILSILKEKRENNFDGIKNIYNYLQYRHKDKKIDLNEIPISKDNEPIKYFSVKELIWEDGKELELIELKPFYGNELKNFFVNQIGIAEKPTIKEYVEYLKTNQKNHKKSFDKFIKLLDEDIDKNYFVKNEKIILINEIFYSFDEIIFNDEYIDDKENKIRNLFSIEKKSESKYKNILEKFEVKKLGNYHKSIEISNSTMDDEIFDIYMKLLNYLWDYLYSKDEKEFEKLKDDKNFIVKTKSIQKGAFSEINVKIKIENEFLQINKKVEITDNTIHICSEIDKRELVKEIANFLSEKTKQITSEKLELFYKDVYKSKDYKLEEYYEKNEIKTPVDEKDKFDNVFENIKLEKNEKETDSILDDSNLNQEKPVDNKTTITESENKNIIPPQFPQKKSTDFDKQKQENEITTPDMLDAIKQHNKEIDKRDEELEPAIIIDKNKFMKKAQEEQREDLEKSNQETKKRYSSQKIKEGKEEIRFFLEREYKGHCQICGFTFDKKNNQGKYFQLFDWLSEKITKQKNNGVYIGSSLCLCSKCWSILKFGDFKSKFIDNLQKENMDLNKFTFDQFCDVTTKQTENIEIPEKFEFSMDYKIPIRLLNEDKCIFYTQEHFKRFFIFLSKE